MKLDLEQYSIQLDDDTADLLQRISKNTGTIDLSTLKAAIPNKDDFVTFLKENDLDSDSDAMTIVSHLETNTPLIFVKEGRRQAASRPVSTGILPLKTLLIQELRNLYDAEKQLITIAFPKMAKAATDAELKSNLSEHLEQIKGRPSRFEQVFEHLGLKVKGTPCAGMKGLVAQVLETTLEDEERFSMDLMIIAGAQKLEHYQISAYGSVLLLTEWIGMKAVADFFRQTVDEEAEANLKLTQIANRLLAEMIGGGKDEDLDEEVVEEAAAKAQVKRGRA